MTIPVLRNDINVARDTRVRIDADVVSSGHARVVRHGREIRYVAPKLRPGQWQRVQFTYRACADDICSQSSLAVRVTGSKRRRGSRG